MQVPGSELGRLRRGLRATFESESRRRRRGRQGLVWWSAGWGRCGHQQRPEHRWCRLVRCRRRWRQSHSIGRPSRRLWNCNRHGRVDRLWRIPLNRCSERTRRDLGHGRIDRSWRIHNNRCPERSRGSPGHGRVCRSWRIPWNRRRERSWRNHGYGRSDRGPPPVAVAWRRRWRRTVCSPDQPVRQATLHVDGHGCGLSFR